MCVTDADSNSCEVLICKREQYFQSLYLLEAVQGNSYSRTVVVTEGLSWEQYRRGTVWIFVLRQQPSRLPRHTFMPAHMDILAHPPLPLYPTMPNSQYIVGPARGSLGPETCHCEWMHNGSLEHRQILKVGLFAQIAQRCL